MPDASRYTARWQHRMKLRFRVWPKFKETHKAILKEKAIPINGIRINDDGTPEVWNMTAAGVCGQIFEVDGADFDIIAAIPKAGARRIGRMRVFTPGTADNRFKKECWLELDVLAYKDTPENPITIWGDHWNNTSPHEVFGETPEDALGLAGAGTPKIVFFEKDSDIDEDLILREVLGNDAMIVLNHRIEAGRPAGVSSRRGRELVDRAKFWCVPGRDPLEDGGALRGYQFADRIVRWTRRVEESSRAEEHERHMARIHNATREKGKATRRKYFIEETVTRFSERVGWTHEQTMERFLEDGIVDWLLRSVDNVPPVAYREASALLRGRVTDAINALEFFYAARKTLEGGAQ